MMDHLIIYKQGESLKSTFEAIRLSQQRAYRLDFATSLQMLQQNLKADTRALLYLFIQSLSDQMRIVIKNIQQACPDVRICLCAQADHALDAWKLDLFHFEAYPITNRQLKHAYHKYTNQLNGTKEHISIKTSEGTKSIACRQINYLKADGNYTEIHLKQDQKIVITKQLNQFVYITEMNRHLERLHRSYIFNLANIRQIKGKELRFYQSEQVLQLSQALADKVRKTLLSK